MNYSKRSKIYSKIESDLKLINKFPKIVGVTGVDNAGKTEFTKGLHAYLKSNGHSSTLLHLDDFHNEKKVRYQLDDKVESYIKCAFDLDKIEKNILLPLKMNGSVNTTLNLLDLDSDTFINNKTFEIRPNSIVLFEGVMLFRPPLDQYIDYRVFIDISFSQMVPRALRRDGGSVEEVSKVYQDKRIPIQKKYFEIFKPKQRSDLVVLNDNYFNPEIEYFSFSD
ncbi:MAG: hypothetical protein ISR65_13390 [Bacteriovoracaceae bacterium]|nr:hypothetical protein [Bacteriovoracaceae bacterium]